MHLRLLLLEIEYVTENKSFKKQIARGFMFFVLFARRIIKNHCYDD